MLCCRLGQRPDHQNPTGQGSKTHNVGLAQDQSSKLETTHLASMLQAAARLDATMCSQAFVIGKVYVSAVNVFFQDRDNVKTWADPKRSLAMAMRSKELSAGNSRAAAGKVRVGRKAQLSSSATPDAQGTFWACGCVELCSGLDAHLQAAAQGIQASGESIFNVSSFAQNFVAADLRLGEGVKKTWNFTLVRTYSALSSEHCFSMQTAA